MTAKTIKAMVAEAQAKGKKTFDPGRPCLKGHVSHRYASSDARCIMCSDLKDFNSGRKSELRRGNLQLQPDGSYSGWPCKVCGCTKRNKNKKCVDCVYAMYLKKLPKTVIDERKRRKENPEKFKRQSKERYEKDKSQKILDSTIRRAKKKSAIPAWVDLSHRKRMRQFYKNCPVGFEIDHVVPLSHPLVVGLHCEANLQYLISIENRQKSNKWPTCQKSMQPACFDNLDNGVRV